MAKLKEQDRNAERLGSVFLLGMVLFNPLVLKIFDVGADEALFGIPIFYLYLFLGWALMVGLMALITERGSADGELFPEAEPRTPENQ